MKINITGEIIRPYHASSREGFMFPWAGVSITKLVQKQFYQCTINIRN